MIYADDPDHRRRSGSSVSLLLFRCCCNQRRLIEFLSSIAVAANRFTAVVAAINAADPEL